MADRRGKTDEQFEFNDYVRDLGHAAKDTPLGLLTRASMYDRDLPAMLVRAGYTKEDIRKELGKTDEQQVD
jgi:hypothetical protein